MRLRLVQPSMALIAGSLFTIAVALAWQFLPERSTEIPHRDPFAVFPRSIEDWKQIGRAETLAPDVERALQADDYRSVSYLREQDTIPVSFFSAWYKDQSEGGVHSPEVCLPSSGWEIAWLERVDIAESLNSPVPFNINKAIIQKSETRMMVYYWFEQKGRKVAWDFAAKLYLVQDGITSGRKDGAIVRLTTLIGENETDADAAARLEQMVQDIVPVMPRFIPGAS